MAISIQQLRERRDALAKGIHALMEANPGDKWGVDQQQKYDADMAEIDRVNNEIDRHAQYMAKIADQAGTGGNDDLLNQHVRTPGAHSEESGALRAFLAGGIANMTAEDTQRMRARQPADIRNTMSTTTLSEGGYTVATEYYRQLTEAMKQYGGLLEAATVLQTASGASMNFPTADATAEEGEIVGQNVPGSRQDTGFGNTEIPTYRYSSKSVAVPFELIQDSMFDIEAYIRAVLAVRLGRITARHFTVGTGVGQPRGLVTASPVGKIGATGQTVDVTYDDLVTLEHSVDPAYRKGAGVGFMMHDQMLANVRKIKDSSGRPIFVPGYDQGNPGGAPDRLLNRAIRIAQEMPVPAANAKTIAFGDLSKYVARQVMDLTMFRMADSKYVEAGQIGFIAFNRQGGNLVDVGGAVKLYQQSAT